MGRPPIGSRPLTKTERQRRWWQRKRLAPVTEPSHQSAGDAKPDPFVIRPKPAAVSDHGKYAAIIAVAADHPRISSTPRGARPRQLLPLPIFTLQPLDHFKQVAPQLPPSLENPS